MSKRPGSFALTILLTLIAVARTEAADPGPTLTLDGAVAEALTNNRSVAVAGMDLEKAELRLAAARTRRLPALDVTMIAGELLHDLEFEFPRGAFGNFQATGPIPAADATITTDRRFTTVTMATASQPLTQLSRIGHSVRLAELDAEIAREALRRERQAVAAAVKGAYYDVVVTRSALAALEDALSLYRELDRTVSDRLAHQAALKAEALDVRARLARTEYEALTARNALATRKERLNLLLGRDIRTGFDVDPIPEAAPLERDLESAQARALQSRPDVREGRLRVRQADQDARVKRSEYIPDVSLSLRYISLANFDQILPKNYSSIGFMLSWEPWDWGRKRRELAEKRRTMEQAAARLTEAESAVLVEVNARFRSLEEARALLAASRAEEEAARERVRVVADRYSRQAALLKDVLQEQAALSEAAHRFQEALASHWTARAELEKSLGED